MDNHKIKEQNGNTFLNVGILSPLLFYDYKAKIQWICWEIYSLKFRFDDFSMCVIANFN